MNAYNLRLMKIASLLEDMNNLDAEPHIEAIESEVIKTAAGTSPNVWSLVGMELDSLKSPEVSVGFECIYNLFMEAPWKTGGIEFTGDDWKFTLNVEGESLEVIFQPWDAEIVEVKYNGELFKANLIEGDISVLSGFCEIYMALRLI